MGQILVRDKGHNEIAEEYLHSCVGLLWAPTLLLLLFSRGKPEK